MTVKFRLRQLIAEKEAKEDRHISYREIQKVTGINQNSITAMVNNNQKQIALNTIDRLCDFFDCDISDLLVREKED